MPDTATQLRAHLHFVELGSPDPQRLAGFYAELFDAPLTRDAGRFIVRDQDRAIVVSPGPAKSLLSAGYSVDNPGVLNGLRQRLAANGTPAEPAASPLYQEGAVRFRDPDGNTFHYGVAAPASTARTGLPGRLQHVVVGSTDCARSLAFHHDTVGLRLSDRVLTDDGELRTAFLRTDDEHHSFAVFQTSDNRLDHHTYETTGWGDLRDWGDRLAARYVQIAWGPGRHGPGNNLFLFFHDPDGNFVEISAELEVVAPGKPAGEWPHTERSLNLWGRGFLRT